MWVHWSQKGTLQHTAFARIPVAPLSALVMSAFGTGRAAKIARPRGRSVGVIRRHAQLVGMAAYHHGRDVVA